MDYRKREYVYKNKMMHRDDISRKTGVHLPILKPALDSVEIGSDVTDLVLSLTKWFIVDGDRYTQREIANEFNFDSRHFRTLLKELDSGADVSEDVHRIQKKQELWYMYEGRKYKVKPLAKRLGTDFRTLKSLLDRLGIESGTDVTKIVQTSGSKQRAITARLYLVNNVLLSVHDAAREANMCVDTLYGRIERANRKAGEDITDLLTVDFTTPEEAKKLLAEITGDMSIGGFGVKVSAANVFKFLALKGYHRTSEITKKLLVKYNYEGRKKLGFDKACRSKWLTDDLWEYTCPVCGKKLVLTTAQIVAHEHGSMCEDSVEDLLNEESSYVLIQK